MVQAIHAWLLSGRGATVLRLVGDSFGKQFLVISHLPGLVADLLHSSVINYCFESLVAVKLDWNLDLVGDDRLSAGRALVGAKLLRENVEAIIAHYVLAGLKFYQLSTYIIWRLLVRFGVFKHLRH